MRISDWSSDVCSSDLPLRALRGPGARMIARGGVVEARRVAPEIPVLPTRKACRGVAAALTLLAPVVSLGRGGACPHVIGTLDPMARVVDRVASARTLPGGTAVRMTTPRRPTRPGASEGGTE